jgi:hypothetical protein
MPRVSGADYQAILDVLGEAAAVDRPNPFPVKVLDTLRRLVPCNLVSYHVGPIGGRSTVSWTGEIVGAMTDEIRAVVRRYWRQERLAPSRARARSPTS